MSGIPNAATAATWGDRPSAPGFEIGAIRVNPTQGLFARLMAAGMLSSKTLANLVLAFRRHDPLSGDIERCPHCGGVLRVRAHVTKAVRDAINAWLKGGL